MADPITPAPASPPATPPPAAPPAAPPTAPPKTLIGGEPPAPSGAPGGAPPAPEEITVKFPDGFKIEKPVYDEFLGVAKKAGLKSESAQAVADFYVKMQSDADLAQQTEITKWAEEAKSDPEIGGANFDSSIVAANKALGKLATKEFRELLATTGLGNHKEVIRLLAKVGKAVSEDRLPGGDDKGGGTPTDRLAQLKEAFPNSPELWK